jgi:hypothetical protein
VMLFLAFVFEDVGRASGFVDGGWLDLARFSIGGGVGRWRAQIQGRRSPGCIPGRCSTNGDFIRTSVLGVLCGSFQSFDAMGFLQIWGNHAVFSDDGGRRWIDGGGRRRRLLELSGNTGSLDFSLFGTFLGAFVYVGRYSYPCILL